MHPSHMLKMITDRNIHKVIYRTRKDILFEIIKNVQPVEQVTGFKYLGKKMIGI